MKIPGWVERSSPEARVMESAWCRMSQTIADMYTEAIEQFGAAGIRAV